MDIAHEAHAPANEDAEAIVYRDTIALFDGSIAVIRPICPADEQMMIAFHQGLSDRAVEHRYFYHMKLASRIASERLKGICHCTAENIGLVAQRADRATGKHEIVAVGRLAAALETRDAELAVVIADRWQHHHLGTALLRGLLQIAQQKNLMRVYMMVLPDNLDMLRLCDHFGFTARQLSGEPITASKDIPPKCT